MYKQLLSLTALLLLLNSPLQAKSDFRVVVSIKPIHSILSGLMQGVESPELLVKGKNHPYFYRPSKSQIKSIQNADLVIWTGPELEPHLQSTISKLPKTTHVIELLDSPSMKILPQRHDASLRDPYFWLDSRNALLLLDEMTQILIDADNVRSHLYLRNRSKVLATLSKVDREFEYGYRGLKSGVGYLYLDTLQYFEQAYALKIEDALIAAPDKQPDTSQLLRTRTQIKDKTIQCLLTESGIATPHLGLLTENTDINIHQLDTIGTQFEAGPDLYAQLMHHNTRIIKDCLGLVVDKKAMEAAIAPIGQSDGRFILMNHLNNPVTDKDMLGKYQLLYFGYTSCPDICPLSLQLMLHTLRKMEKDADHFQPYFISVDPERDKPGILFDYVTYFDQKLIGLTGTPTMIKRMAKHFNVRYEKVIDDPEHPERYTMDHTASIFLIAPDGRFVTKLSHNLTPSQLQEKLQQYVH
ncbi:MAG: SCO family protein [Gammaproteobacteria bacterium]|nr:SCO family protein [Gammaproteobacteria bacterium]